MTAPTSVIFALDGTLADVTALHHLVSGHRPAFTAPASGQFYTRSIAAPPIAAVARLARLEKLIGHEVVILTERPERWRALSEAWLLLNGIPADRVLMRADGDFRPDVTVKEDLLASLGDREIIHAYENRADAAVLYESHGIPVTFLAGSELGAAARIPAHV